MTVWFRLFIRSIHLAVACVAACSMVAAQDLDMPPLISDEGRPPAPFQHASDYGDEPAFADHAPYCDDCFDESRWQEPWNADLHGGVAYPWLTRLHDFTTRHSTTHGRSIGHGGPLRGTSWLNRPYEVSAEFGAFIMTGNPADGVTSGNDLFAAIHAGWDWDHYWGTQFRVGWTTPSFDTTAVANEPDSDNLFLADLSTMYYPWGDSRLRPYWRVGLGLTDLEFTTAANVRRQETLFTIPIGLGVKYQHHRSLAWRAELVDNLAFGGTDANTMHNLTLTFGLEGRFGGRPAGYWAWHPRGHVW